MHRNGPGHLVAAAAAILIVVFVFALATPIPFTVWIDNRGPGRCCRLFCCLVKIGSFAKQSLLLSFNDFAV